MVKSIPLSGQLTALPRGERPAGALARAAGRRGTSEKSEFPLPVARVEKASTVRALAEARADVRTVLERFGREAPGSRRTGPEFRHPGQILDIEV